MSDRKELIEMLRMKLGEKLVGRAVTNVRLAPRLKLDLDYLILEFDDGSDLRVAAMKKKDDLDGWNNSLLYIVVLDENDEEFEGVF